MLIERLQNCFGPFSGRLTGLQNLHKPNNHASLYKRFVPFGHYMSPFYYYALSIKAPPSDYEHCKRLVLYLCLTFVWFVSTMSPFKHNLVL